MLKKSNIALYFILNIFTLGISSIFFWYKWTEKVNTVCEGDDRDSANYILVLILSVMTCGIYTLIWNYQMGERLYQIAPKYGVEIKHGGIFVMLLRFVPIACSVVKFVYANKLIAQYNANLAANAQPEAAAE